MHDNRFSNLKFYFEVSIPSFFVTFFQIIVDFFKTLFLFSWQHYDDDISDLDLFFSYDEDCMGRIVTHDLLPGGKVMAVTNDNK